MTDKDRSDKDKLIALLTEFGVEFKCETFERYTNSERPEQHVIMESGDTKVVGHGGFYTSFCFDMGGNFIEMGAWE